MKCVSLLESFGSLSDFISDFVVAAESSCKDLWEFNRKFVGNIPGWDDAWNQVWCVGLKIRLDNNFFYRYEGGMLLLVRWSQA